MFKPHSLSHYWSFPLQSLVVPHNRWGVKFILTRLNQTLISAAKALPKLCHRLASLNLPAESLNGFEPTWSSGCFHTSPVLPCSDSFQVSLLIFPPVVLWDALLYHCRNFPPSRHMHYSCLALLDDLLASGNTSELKFWDDSCSLTHNTATFSEMHKDTFKYTYYLLSTVITIVINKDWHLLPCGTHCFVTSLNKTGWLKMESA